MSCFVMTFHVTRFVWSKRILADKTQRLSSVVGKCKFFFPLRLSKERKQRPTKPHAAREPPFGHLCNRMGEQKPDVMQT